jgi:hypothetical protein
MMNFVLFLPFFGLELSTEVGVEFSTIDCKCNKWIGMEREGLRRWVLSLVVGPRRENFRSNIDGV